MAVRRPKYNGKTVVNLDGPDGNHFVLMGYAKQWCSQLGLNFQDIHEEIKQGGNYTTTIKILNKHFGAYVDFETDQEDLINAIK